MMRLDPSIWPTKQKCATVGEKELQEQRGFKDVKDNVKDNDVKNVKDNVKDNAQR